LPSDDIVVMLLSPVVLIPGLCGSVVEVKLDGGPAPHAYCSTDADWFVQWVTVDAVTPRQKDCLVARLTPTYDPDTQTYADAAGVTINAHYDWGGVGSVEYLDPELQVEGSAYFADMIAYLEARGYERRVNLHAAGYDWRMAPDAHALDYYPKLKSLIESTVAANGAPATLVAHSLGCPTTAAFLKTQSPDWIAQHVSTFVSLAGPYAGSVQLLPTYASGDNLGYTAVPDDYLKPVQQVSASGIFLLPDPEVFSDTGLANVSTPDAVYAARDADRLLEALGLDEPRAILRDLAARGLALSNVTRVPPANVSTHVLSSTGVQTPLAYRYARNFAPGFDDPPDEILYGDGDGVVNIESLRRPLHDGWGSSVDVDAASPTEVSFAEFDGVPHFDMVSDARVLAYLGDTVLHLSSPSKPSSGPLEASAETASTATAR